MSGQSRSARRTAAAGRYQRNGKRPFRCNPAGRSARSRENRVSTRAPGPFVPRGKDPAPGRRTERSGADPRRAERRGDLGPRGCTERIPERGRQTGPVRTPPHPTGPRGGAELSHTPPPPPRNVLPRPRTAPARRRHLPAGSPTPPGGVTAPCLGSAGGLSVRGLFVGKWRPSGGMGGGSTAVCHPGSPAAVPRSRSRGLTSRGACPVPAGLRAVRRCRHRRCARPPGALVLRDAVLGGAAQLPQPLFVCFFVFPEE